MNNLVSPDIKLLDNLIGLEGEIESIEYLFRKIQFEIFISTSDKPDVNYIYFMGTTYSGRRNWDNEFLYYNNEWSFTTFSQYFNDTITIKPITYEITNKDNIYNIILYFPIINQTIKGEKKTPLYNLYNFIAYITYNKLTGKVINFKIKSTDNRLKLKSFKNIDVSQYKIKENN
tara:strand:- start:5125 stop:5646 length:522 start_codon:yes stop_codon:yes gene_type:complete